MMQESTRSRFSLLPSVSVRGLLLWVALAAVAAAVASGAVQGNRLALAATVSLLLLAAIFAVYAVAFVLAWALAHLVVRRNLGASGPFRPSRPQGPLPRDLAGEEQ